MTLQVGDKVFYPLHGAGIIESIEEMEIRKTKQIYCRLDLPEKKMNVLFPYSKIEELGIRRVAGTEMVSKVKSIFMGEPEVDLPEDAKNRNKVLQEAMEKANLCDMAYIIRDLNFFRKEKKLNKADKDLLDNTRKLFISEWIACNDTSVEQASEWLTEQEHQMVL